MEENKVSILVPIYNIVPYLSDCINSVLNQTYTNWELILVDDGSTDDSPKICDDYAKRDSRISVVHKLNGGLASARNAGMKAAMGDWIMFLDGDDWLSEETLSTCINCAKETGADFIKFSYTMEYSKYKKVCTYPVLKSKEDYMQGMLARRIAVPVWGGLYKKSLFDNLTPRFTEGVNFGEDYSVLPRLLYLAQKPIFIKDCMYHYRILNGGYVGTCKWSNVEQLVKAEDIINDFFCKKDNGRYKLSLMEGRAYIKSFSLGYILSNYSVNKTHIDAWRGLYNNDIDFTEFSSYNKLLIHLSLNAGNIKLAQTLFLARRYLFNMVKNLIGRNRM